MESLLISACLIGENCKYNGAELLRQAGLDILGESRIRELLEAE